MASSEKTKDSGRAALRFLPAVDELLRHPTLLELVGLVGHGVARDLAQKAVADRRTALLEGQEGAAAGLSDKSEGLEALAADARRLAEAEARRGLTRVVNATGVVLHTGLGRAPVHPEAAEAMAEMASSYCTLEIDRESGGRGRRDARAGSLAAQLFGAEAGICVNNCASAVLLTLSAMARDREVILSRGELVEIGGSFRMPDVMRAAGCHLREVGTTNRTRIADMRAAITENTGLLLKVHTSNYRVVGFTEEVEPEELAALGKETGLPTALDAGSGLCEAENLAPLEAVAAGEPSIRAALAAGVDLVMFSGDKLLGGPQAGLILGTAKQIAALRADPIYRAVRMDKSALAGLEKTLELLLTGRGDEIPSRRLLRATRSEVAVSAEALAEGLRALPGLTVELLDGDSKPGSGSAPDTLLPTRLVALGAQASAEELGRRLRLGDPPVFTRIQDDRLLLDPRTLLEGDQERLISGLQRVLTEIGSQ